MKPSIASKVLAVTALFIFTLFVNSCYDDTELKDRLTAYEARLQALEQLCSYGA